MKTNTSRLIILSIDRIDENPGILKMYSYKVNPLMFRQKITQRNNVVKKNRFCFLLSLSFFLKNNKKTVVTESFGSG